MGRIGHDSYKRSKTIYPSDVIRRPCIFSAYRRANSALRTPWETISGEFEVANGDQHAWPRRQVRQTGK